MNILHIDASPLGTGSVSRQLTAEVARRLKSLNPAATIKPRDLIATPVGHLSGELLQILRPVPGSTPIVSNGVRADAELDYRTAA